MFRAMIAEDALDIRYAPNQVKITDEQSQANQSLECQVEPALAYLIMEQTRYKQRPKEEDGYSKAQ